jgi:hypothetical protein
MTMASNQKSAQSEPLSIETEFIGNYTIDWIPRPPADLVGGGPSHASTTTPADPCASTDFGWQSSGSRLQQPMRSSSSKFAACIQDEILRRKNGDNNHDDMDNDAVLIESRSSLRYRL